MVGQRRVGEYLRDMFVTIRGKRVSRAELTLLEKQCGGLAIHDHVRVGDSTFIGRRLIDVLDAAWLRHFEKKGKPPSAIDLREDPFAWYRPAYGVTEHGLVGTRKDPAFKIWFRIPRKISVSS